MLYDTLRAPHPPFLRVINLKVRETVKYCHTEGKTQKKLEKTSTNCTIYFLLVCRNLTCD